MEGPGRVGLLVVVVVSRVDTIDDTLDSGSGGDVLECETEGDGRSSVETEDGDCGGITRGLGNVDTGDCGIEDDWLCLGSSDSVGEVDDGDRA
jgi:hypothetical protein